MARLHQNQAQRQPDHILDQLVRALRRYVILPQGGAEAVALWAAFTHTIDAFDIAALLAILSPVRGCGKTTLMLILRVLVAKPQATSNISPAALFRFIAKEHPTLLIDEVDTQLSTQHGSGRNDELRNILNAGHTRTTAKVIRCVGQHHEVKEFDTWGAKVLAGIGKLPTTIQDRAITVPMRRRLPHEHIERIRQDRIEEEFESLRAALAQWAEDNRAALREADPDVPDGLSDRACDNWRPLLAIADVAGGDWSSRARDAAVLLNSSPVLEEDIGTLLLTDLRRLFRETGERFMLTDRVLSSLIGLEARPWATFTYGQPLTSSGLARRLKEFGIASQQKRHKEQVLHGYALADFEDAFERYLPVEDPKPRVAGVAGCSGLKNQVATAKTRRILNNNDDDDDVVAGVAGVAGSRKGPLFSTLAFRKPLQSLQSLQPNKNGGKSVAGASRVAGSWSSSRPRGASLRPEDFQ